MSSQELVDLALSVVTNGPHKKERADRRIRGMVGRKWLFDTTDALRVWEHPYYPQYYVPISNVQESRIHKLESVDKNERAFLANIEVESCPTSKLVVLFEDGLLRGMVRFDFGSLDAWFEEEQQIYVHPKDPYKRIDILPSSRRIVVKVDGIVIAESTFNMFLFETMLQTRYYMPKSAWHYTTPSETTTMCPYKGMAEYYNLCVNGQNIEDAVWWYRHPTQESFQIAGVVTGTVAKILQATSAHGLVGNGRIIYAEVTAGASIIMSLVFLFLAREPRQQGRPCRRALIYTSVLDAAMFAAWVIAFASMLALIPPVHCSALSDFDHWTGVDSCAFWKVAVAFAIASSVAWLASFIAAYSWIRSRS
ncbi:MAG: hypothetical protein Q9174_000098 [Haloplaca sp. 1 TL-2023]